MTKPQFIKTEAGEELVVLTRNDYEDLVALAELGEDLGTARIIERSKAAIAAGDDILIPGEVVHSISHGENPVRVIREWRGLTQGQLARRNKLTEGYIAKLEAGGSASQRALKAIAKTLKVPVDLLTLD
jgi:DNA-binding XRE family transcriptional regulator